MAVNSNSPQSLPLKDQVPINPRLRNDFASGLPEHMPHQEMTPSLVAPDEDNDKFLGLY